VSAVLSVNKKKKSKTVKKAKKKKKKMNGSSGEAAVSWSVVLCLNIVTFEIVTHPFYI